MSASARSRCGAVAAAAQHHPTLLADPHRNYATADARAQSDRTQASTTWYPRSQSAACEAHGPTRRRRRGMYCVVGEPRPRSGWPTRKIGPNQCIGTRNSCHGPDGGLGVATIIEDFLPIKNTPAGTEPSSSPSLRNALIELNFRVKPPERMRDGTRKLGSRAHRCILW